MPKRAPADIVNLKLRLPEHLRARLEREARKGDHSLNSEIIDRLERSFSQPQLAAELRMTVKAEVERALLEVTGRGGPQSHPGAPVARTWPVQDKGKKS